MDFEIEKFVCPNLLCPDCREDFLKELPPDHPCKDCDMEYGELPVQKPLTFKDVIRVEPYCETSLLTLLKKQMIAWINDDEKFYFKIGDDLHEVKSEQERENFIMNYLKEKGGENNGKN